jgi:hypothetical protein
MLQAWIRVFNIKKQIKVMLEQRAALSVLQRNIKASLSLRNWGWMKLFNLLKPMLQNSAKREVSSFSSYREI